MTSTTPKPYYDYDNDSWHWFLGEGRSWYLPFDVFQRLVASAFRTEREAMVALAAALTPEESFKLFVLPRISESIIGELKEHLTQDSNLLIQNGTYKLGGDRITHMCLIAFVCWLQGADATPVGLTEAYYAFVKQNWPCLAPFVRWYDMGERNHVFTEILKWLA